jgi:hypothetical protein
MVPRLEFSTPIDLDAKPKLVYRGLYLIIKDLSRLTIHKI